MKHVEGTLCDSDEMPGLGAGGTTRDEQAILLPAQLPR